MTLHSEIANHSTTALAVCGLLVAAFWIVSTITNDPLKSVGGAIFSRLTSIQLSIQVLRGRRPYFVHDLHQQNGPLIRVGPNEVSTTDRAAIRAIYKVGSPFTKSRWYTDFTGLLKSKNSSLFSQRDNKLHGQHRRIQSNNFSEKWLKVLEPDMIRNVKMAANGMGREVESTGHFDVFKWSTFMATDVVGEAAFGESFKLLESGQRNQYIDDLEKVGYRGILNTVFPKLMNWLGRLPFGYVAEAGQGQARVGKYGAQSIARYQNRWEADKESVKPSLMTNEFNLVEEGTMTQAQVSRDATGYIVAGTDTTANTATYMFWELANHPEVQAQVIEAVQQLPEDCTDDDMKHSEIFTHVINETLRLRGPAPAALPRVVPESGLTICGKFIPAGTIVSTQAYTLHRDPEIWEDPLSFNPSRWQTPTKEMKESFMPFGAGSRICIGMHFATMELHHALINFYRTFPRGVTPAYVEDFSPKEMEQAMYFIAQPRGKRCLLRPL